MHEERIRNSAPVSNRLLGRAGRLLVCIIPLLCCYGCGYTQGKLLYFMGFGRGQKIEALFRLTNGPILIFLDDPHGRMDWPPARATFEDDLAQALIKNKAAKKIIPRRTLEGLRQSTPDFEKRGCREIGEMAGADQVIWVQVQAFRAEAQFSDTNQAAYLTVTVKVISATEPQRSRARVWPSSPAGHRVHVSMTGADVAMEKTKPAISAKLAAKLARHVARLFYNHRLNDFGREE